MAFTGSFTKTNDGATALNAFIIADTSSYADEAKVTFSGRKVYLYDIYGDAIVDAATGLGYWDFSFASFPDDEIAINTLSEDIALKIRLVWESLNPQVGSTYIAYESFDFLDYANQFKYGKVLALAGNKNLKSNKNFFETLSILQANIDSSHTSIANDDQYESQMCILNTQYIMANPNLFY